jgi:HEAT repeat protein
VVKRRRIILAVVALLALGVVAALVWPREREPEYQGKKLSEWLWTPEMGGMEAPAEAVRAIGTNALPWLVRWIAYEPTSWNGRVKEFLMKLPIGSLRRKLWEREGLVYQALWGFEILGSRASPAVPDLVRLTNDPRKEQRCSVAMGALGYVGQEGFSPLLEVLERGGAGRFNAAAAIVQMHRSGVDISAAFPALLVQERENRKFVGPNFSLDLETLAKDSAFFITALTNCLRHTNGDVRAEAARALGMLREGARPAVGPLMGAITDPVLLVREEATNALRKIAPEVLQGRAVGE